MAHGNPSPVTVFILQPFNYPLKTRQPRFQILYNLFRQHIRIRKVVQVCKALVMVLI